ncbi:hypothetical protein ACFVXG_25795 [Kitasatospora sp. NPDC058162]|uniref:hypothetical protein n=1 Tax=Kitasatospora sp. NPDC058162 TaxID=3346362 RepID=UPI0036DC7CAB
MKAAVAGAAVVTAVLAVAAPLHGIDRVNAAVTNGGGHVESQGQGHYLADQGHYLSSSLGESADAVAQGAAYAYY